LNVNQVFKIIADGKQVGISVAPNSEAALEFARKALTRRTASKWDSEADYPVLTAEPLTPPEPITQNFVKKLLARISTVANSRFAEV
jgi:hypothetical protein